jgi:hypothetical protein
MPLAFVRWCEGLVEHVSMGDMLNDADGDCELDQTGQSLPGVAAQTCKRLDRGVMAGQECAYRTEALC